MQEHQDGIMHGCLSPVQPSAILAWSEQSTASCHTCLFLQAQAECLTTRFGVSSQVKSVLRQLWLTHLPSTGMLESAPRRSAAAAAGLPGTDAADTEYEDAAQPAGPAAGSDGAEEPLSSTLVDPVHMRSLFWGVSDSSMQQLAQVVLCAVCSPRQIKWLGQASADSAGVGQHSFQNPNR